jgi:hypothetical protein
VLRETFRFAAQVVMKSDISDPWVHHVSFFFAAAINLVLIAGVLFAQWERGWHFALIDILNLGRIVYSQ